MIYNINIDNITDHILSLSLSTPQEVLHDVSRRFKKRRLELGFTQEGLAKRSGVSLGSLKRFEHTGEVSLNALLRMAWVLECLDDFNKLAEKPSILASGLSLDDILAKKKTMKRGHIQ